MTPVDGVRLDELARDALREVVNVGTGSALTALARMLSGARINMSPPELVRGSAGVNLTRLEDAGVALLFSFEGMAEGRFIVTMDHASVAAMLGALLGRGMESGLVDDEGEGALREVGNIVACSFLDSVVHLVGGVLMPSTPEVKTGRLDNIVSSQLSHFSGPVVLSNAFDSPAAGFSGRILTVFSEAQAETLAGRLGLSPAAAES